MKRNIHGNLNKTTIINNTNITNTIEMHTWTRNSRLFKFSKYSYHNINCRKSIFTNGNQQRCMKIFQRGSKQTQQIHRGKGAFNFLQKRLYNRPWSKPPSFSQSSSNFNFQNLHPNNVFVKF